MRRVNYVEILIREVEREREICRGAEARAVASSQDNGVGVWEW